MRKTDVSRETNADWKKLPPEQLLSQALKELSVELAPSRIKLLIDFLSEVLAWNKKTNLIGPTTLPEAIITHLADSLSPLPWITKSKSSVLDIGSGGGFPAIALKIARPDLKMTLAEPKNKKWAFLKAMARKFNLENMDILPIRINPPHDKLETRNFDLVTARALAPLSELLPLAHPYLKKSGTCIAYKAKLADQELSEAGNLKALGFKLADKKEITLPFTNHSRTLLFFEVL